MSGGKLVVMDRTGRDIKRFSLPRGLVTLGSDPGCDIRILLPSISGHHANVVVHAKQTVVRHVSDSGETLVNGQPISVASLHHGDTITLGERSLRWEYDDPQAAKPAVLPSGSLIVKKGKQKGGRGRKRASDPASKQLNTSIQYQLELNHRASMPASAGSGKPVARVPPQRRDTNENNDSNQSNPRLVVKPHRPYAQTNKRPRTFKNDSSQELSSYAEEQDPSKRKSSVKPNVKTPDLTTKASMWIELRKSTPRRSAIQSPAIDSPVTKTRNSRTAIPSVLSTSPRATRMSASPKSPIDASTSKTTPKLATPKRARKVATPKSAAKVVTPKSAKRVVTPKSATKDATPKTASKVSPAKSIARASTSRTSIATTPTVVKTPRSFRTPTPAKISPRLTLRDTRVPGKDGVTSKIPIVARHVSSVKKTTPLRTFVLRKTLTPKTRDVLYQSVNKTASTPKVTKIQDPLKIDLTKQAALMLMTASKTKISPKSYSQRVTPGLVVTRPSSIKTPVGKKSPQSAKKSSKSAKKSPKSAKKSPIAHLSILDASDSSTPFRSNSVSSIGSRRSNKSFTDSLVSLSSRSSRSQSSRLSQTPDSFSLPSPSPRKSALKDPSTKTSRKGESIKFDLSNVEYSYDSSDALILTNTTRRSVSDSSYSDDETLKFSNISTSPSPRSPIRSRSSKILEKSLGSPVSIVSPASTLTPGSPRSRPSLRGSLMVEKVMQSPTNANTSKSSIKSTSTPTSAQKKRGSASPNKTETYSIVDLVSFDSTSSSTSSVYGSARSGRNSLFGTPQSTKQSTESLGNMLVSSSTPYIKKSQKTPKRSTSLSSLPNTPASTRRSKSTSAIQHITVESNGASRRNHYSDLFINSTLSIGDTTISPKRKSNSKNTSQSPRSINSSRVSAVALSTSILQKSNTSPRTASKRSLSSSPVSTPPPQKTAKTTPKSAAKSPKVTPKSAANSPKVTRQSTAKSPKVIPHSTAKSPRKSAPSLVVTPSRPSKTPQRPISSTISASKSPKVTPRSSTKSPKKADKTTPATRKSTNTSVVNSASPVSTRKSGSRVSGRMSNSVTSPRSPSFSPLTPTSARKSSAGRKNNPKSASPKRGSKSPRNSTSDANLSDGLHTPENSITPKEAGTPVLNMQNLIDSSFVSVSSHKGRNSRRNTAGSWTSAKSSRSADRSKSLTISSAINKSTPTSKVHLAQEVVKRNHSTAKKPVSRREMIDTLNDSAIGKQLFSSPVKRKLSQSMSEFSRTQLFDDDGEDASPARKRVRNSSRCSKENTANIQNKSSSPYLAGVKQLFSKNTPHNDLTNVRGVRSLLKTPHTRKSTANDLTNISGVKSLFQSGRKNKSHANDLTNISGVKKTLTARSPRNDLTNVSGVKKTLARNSPRNDLTDVRGVKRLFRQEKSQGISDVSGVEELFNESYDSHKNSRNISDSESLFDQLLGKPPIKSTYASKSFAKSPATSRGLKKTKSLHVPVDFTANNVEDWLEQEIQKRVHKNESRAKTNTPKGISKELLKLATETVEGNSPIRTSRVRNSTINDSKATTNTSEAYYNASTLPIKVKHSKVNSSNLKNKSTNDSLPISKRALVHSTPVKGRPNLTANVSELGRVSPISADKTRYVEDVVRITPQASPKSKTPCRKSISSAKKPPATAKKQPRNQNVTPISSLKHTPKYSPRKSQSRPTTPVASPTKEASTKTPPKSVLKRSIRKKAPSAKIASANKILASIVVTPAQSPRAARKTTIESTKQGLSQGKTSPTPKQVTTPRTSRSNRAKQTTPTPKKAKLATPTKGASKQKAPPKNQEVITIERVKPRRGANKTSVAKVIPSSPPKPAKATRGRKVNPTTVQATLVVAKKTPLMSPSPKPNRRNANKQANQSTKSPNSKQTESRRTRGKGKPTPISPKPKQKVTPKSKTPKVRATKVVSPAPKAATPRATRGRKAALVIPKPSPKMKPAIPKSTRSKKPVAKPQTPKPKRGAKIEKSPAKATKQVSTKKTTKISPKKSSKASPPKKATKKATPVIKTAPAKAAKKTKSPDKSKSPVKAATPVKRTRKPVSPAPKPESKKRGQVVKAVPISQEREKKSRKRKSAIESDTPKKVPRQTKNTVVAAKKAAKTPTKGKAKKVQSPPAQSSKGKKRKTEPAKIATPVAKKTRTAAAKKTESPIKTKTRAQKSKPDVAATTSRSHRR